VSPDQAFLGADLLARALSANSFQLVALNPGATEELFASALERAGAPKPILAYQELTVLGLAGGLALGQRLGGEGSGAWGRAAVVAHGMVGLGGMASFITGFAQQKLPVLIIVGNAGVMEDSLGKHQNPNSGLEQLARGAGCKGVFWTTTPDSLVHQLKRATMTAEGGAPGPAALVIPQNGVMAAPAPLDAVIEAIPRAGRGAVPCAEAVRELALRLHGSAAPVILVGDGVARSGAVEDVARVAELCGARVFGSMDHELCFPMDHPLWFGSTGHVFGASAAKLFAGADCVVSVGSVDVSMVFPTSGAPYGSDAWVTFVGEDEAAAASMYRSSASPIIADPKATMALLGRELADMRTELRSAEVLGRVTALMEASRVAREERLAKGNAERQGMPLHAYDVAEALRKVMEELGIEDRVAIVDEGLTRSHAIEDILRPRRPGRYFASRGGSLGYAGPMACGLAFANPAMSVIAISGDGGFLYTPQWLLTARENRLCVKCIVFQDDAYSTLIAIAGDQGRPSPDTFLLGSRRRRVASPAPIDFAGLAAGFGGVPAETVAARDEIEGAIRRLLAAEGPALLVAKVA
jgi:benzoylformate decarboxylase